MNLKTKFAGGLLAAALGLGATQASAAMVDTWTFSVTGDWVVGSVLWSGGNGCTHAEASLLSWGACGVGDFPVDDPDPAQSRSGLEVSSGSPVGGIIDTNGAAVDTIEVTHHNNILAGSFASLLSADFITSLTLTPLLPDPDAPLDPVSQTIPVQFSETPNVENCGFESISNCDDIFVLTLGSPTFQFVYDGFLYTTVIGATGLGPLPAATCAAAGAAAGCFGLTTLEAATTPVQFNFSISAQEIAVPAPATLALMGMGLLGIGALARRRRS